MPVKQLAVDHCEQHTKKLHGMETILTSSVSNMTGLEENGDGSAVITG